MIDLNNCQIIGHVGKEPELRFTPSGKPVCNFTVAYNYRHTNKDGETKEKTEWFHVIVWGKLGEVCNQYIVKGATVYISGRVELYEWTNNDNKLVSRLNLVANKVIFLDKSGNSGLDDTVGVLESGDIPF